MPLLRDCSSFCLLRSLWQTLGVDSPGYPTQSLTAFPRISPRRLGPGSLQPGGRRQDRSHV